jgi:CRP-like cAMP-binding protein
MRSGDDGGPDSDLRLGRSALMAGFGRGSPRLLRAGQPLRCAGSSDVLYRLQSGWAYRFYDLTDGSRAIVDVYLPGDIIGFVPPGRQQPAENVLTLTTAVVDAVAAEEGLSGLLASHPVAVYVAWLLGERQRRADRLISAISCLDARGRVATMVLDFYQRLESQQLITTSSFNLPLTQHHIGSYLGLTVVHVNRVIRALRDAAVVNIEKHWVTLLDLKALAALAKVDMEAEGRDSPAAASLVEATH